jgi:dolichol-phosphate mannosyltransferase
MTGFFAVRLARLDLEAFRPQGFKILLELLVRADRPKVVELPFHFAERYAGESKASLAEGARFLRLVTTLRVAKTCGSPLLRARLGRAAAFGLVGASGVLVNSLLLWLLVSGVELHYVAAAVLATGGASAWNFLWTERWVFAGPKPMTGPRRFLRFTLLNNLAMLVSIPVMVLSVSGLGVHYVAANVLTTGLVFVARFLPSERLVYRSRGFVTLLRTRHVERYQGPSERVVSA